MLQAPVKCTLVRCSWVVVALRGGVRGLGTTSAVFTLTPPGANCVPEPSLCTQALGPLRAMLLPLPLPMEMLHSMEPAVALTKEDRQALNMIRALIDLVSVVDLVWGDAAGVSLLMRLMPCCTTGH